MRGNRADPGQADAGRRRGQSVIRACYARVSSEEQAREGRSIEAQLAQMHTWAAQRGETTIDYVDAGVSAHTERLEDRPALNRLLDDADARKFHALVFTHGDRFARDMLLAEYAWRRLQRAGVEVVDLDNPSGDNLMRWIKAGMAQDYSDKLSLKVKRGLVDRAKAGLHVGTLPFGYCSGRCVDCKASKTCPRWESVPLKSPPILHPVDWHGVLLAFEAYRGGGQSDATVAELLNASGFRSRTRRGRELWSKHGVAWLLCNRSYAGRVVVNGIEYEGRHPAIITPETFAEVQRIRARNYSKPSTWTPKYRVYLFNGLMVCAGCGQHMRAICHSPAPRKRGYVCRSIERKRGNCTRSQGFLHAEQLEAQFGALLSDFTLPDDWQARIMQSVVDAMPHQVDVEAERRRLEGKMSRLRLLYEEGDLELAAYRRDRDAIRMQLDGLIVTPPAETVDAGMYLQSLGAVWGAATMAERREIVMSLLIRVECDPDAKRLVSFTPRPVFAPFFRHYDALSERADGSFDFVFEA